MQSSQSPVSNLMFVGTLTVVGLLALQRDLPGDELRDLITEMKARQRLLQDAEREADQVTADLAEQRKSLQDQRDLFRRFRIVPEENRSVTGRLQKDLEHTPEAMVPVAEKDEKSVYERSLAEQKPLFRQQEPESNELASHVCINCGGSGRVRYSDDVWNQTTYGVRIPVRTCPYCKGCGRSTNRVQDLSIIRSDSFSMPFDVSIKDLTTPW